ncbi:hypothetical protein llap_7463 [Limosa lapponica baueri]|uniref:Uncharacterized protein n=1 Tax=Limosa lapponica baueri TaxID=1758121 RepID=A0A2I0U8C9_LIMLA|nr:hypothetical protein llap_7463 [Limosa lapponica baueri]
MHQYGLGADLLESSSEEKDLLISSSPLFLGVGEGGAICQSGFGKFDRNRKSGQQDDHKPAICPCGQEGQWHPGVHQEECGQQVKGSYVPSLLCPGEAASGVLCPVLGSPIQEGQVTAGEGTAKGYEDNSGTRTSLL